MLNEVKLIGRLGNDPKVFNNETNRSAIFRLATTYKGNITTWHNIKTFGKLSEIVEQNLSKGRLIYIKGRLDYFQQKDALYPECSIIADEILFLDSKKNIVDNSIQSDRMEEYSEDIPF